MRDRLDDIKFELLGVIADLQHDPRAGDVVIQTLNFVINRLNDLIEDCDPSSFDRPKDD